MVSTAFYNRAIHKGVRLFCGLIFILSVGGGDEGREGEGRRTKKKKKGKERKKVGGNVSHIWDTVSRSSALGQGKKIVKVFLYHHVCVEEGKNGG